ncbi:MAG: PKD domain-containing protein [Candidatus Marinimicrobia bacterium]|nr:PKD domain-containing protein [Candidatus Neomarinimicrobiota bacterium]
MLMFNKLFIILALTTIIINISCKKNPTSSVNTEPTAAFTIDPTSGTTSTTFTFDASSSSDNEDITSDLQVRWDWEDNGIWDTDYSTTKTATHQYSAVGTYTVKLEVKDSGGLTDTTTKTVMLSNTAPTASFTIDPTSGTTSTTFNFDASGSSDNEDATSALQVRWDWTNNGSYDTNWSTDKTTTHQYSTAGTYTVKLEVKDTGGLINSTTRQVNVSNSDGDTGTITDIDGNVYNTIQIGNQEWMSENLKVTHYRNGDAIPNVTGNTEWSNLSTGAYCSYDNNDSNIDTYGLLYNWYAVADSRKIAPAGWHIPTDAEWKELEMYLGMSQSEADDTGDRGTDEGGKLKEVGTTHWQSPNTGATNESGFSALPGGHRYYYGPFGRVGYNALFWSTTESNSSSAWTHRLYYSGSAVGRYGYHKLSGFSVRCVRD